MFLLLLVFSRLTIGSRRMHDMCGPYPLSFSNQLKLLPKLVFKAHQKCLCSRSIQLVLFPRCGKRCFDRCIYSVLSPISTHSVKALPTLLIPPPLNISTNCHYQISSLEVLPPPVPQYNPVSHNGLVELCTAWSSVNSTLPSDPGILFDCGRPGDRYVSQVHVSPDTST